MGSILKAWLMDNGLTEDPSDYVARIDSNGTLNKRDIIQSMIDEGMEIKAETAMDVIDRFHRKSIEKAVSGYSVNTGLVNMRPVIRGVFTDKIWNPDQHQLYIAINQSKIIRDAIADTTVSILGVQSDPIEIYSVADMKTGKKDGTITSGRNVEVKGESIKIAGESSDVGVTLRNIASDDTVKLAADEIVLNEPSRLILLIPATLAAGEYELKLSTMYSKGKLLKNSRSIVFNIPLVVV